VPTCVGTFHLRRGETSISKKLLLIAYHFPPFQGSTGIHRTLAFSKYLKTYGWEVTVLTVHPRAYASVSEQNLASIPEHVRVVRSFALDTQRHLSIFGRYPSLLAVPDKWQSWIVGGVLAGRQIIREWRPDALMSTYPIASAHVIGATLQRMSGLPWVADLRDPMLQDEYPSDPRLRRAFERIERKIFSRAAVVTVTTQGTADIYRKRFPAFAARSLAVVPNGFDEDAFAHLKNVDSTVARNGRSKLQLLHSGLLYPKERNPSDFFAAVAELHREGTLDNEKVEFVFRGSGNEATYQAEIDRLGIGSLIKLLPSVPYAQALTELQQADACMLFQASNCNQQIPAKVYEYLYSRKPILALTDPIGDTGQLLSSLNISPVTPLDDKAKIKAALPAFLSALKAQALPIPSQQEVSRFSRRELTAALAHELDRITAR
jgi:glycosyltransferase involved in cell wall biosynthesis